MNENRNAPATQILDENFSSLNPGKVFGALKGWVGLVRGGAEWDYKVDILKSKVLDQNSSQYVTLGDEMVNYQAVANINYQFMASEVGLPQWVAEAGAGAFQIVDHFR